MSARTREIGIRIAVGGRSGQVLRAVLGRTAVVLVAGAVVGIGLAIAATNLLSMVVYQASSQDPLTLAVGAAVMTVLGLTAGWVPARRALHVDPAAVLREG